MTEPQAVTSPEPKKQSTGEQVYAAVRELQILGQSANRYSIHEMTGLPLTIVDDRLKVLKDDGDLFRTSRGQYEIVKKFPAARGITKSVVEGWTIYEIGDTVLRLTPEEHRVFAEMCSGPAVQVAMLETARQHLTLAVGLSEKVESLSRQLRELRQQRNPGQAELTFTECGPKSDERHLQVNA